MEKCSIKFVIIIIVIIIIIIIIIIIKSKQQHYTVKLKILAKLKPYSNLTKRCNLWTTERHFIIFKSELPTLN